MKQITQPTNPMEQIHSFSMSVAKEHGFVAAILAKYIGYKVRASKNRRANRMWYYDTVRELAKKYPYLKKTSINDALNDLIKAKIVIKGRFNQRSYDRTRWFGMDKGWLVKVENKPLKFAVSDAVKYGILEALILQNLAYWISHNRTKDPAHSWQVICPSNCGKLWGGTKSTVQRALTNLVGEGELERRLALDRSGSYEYRIIDEQRLAAKPVENAVDSNPVVGASDPTKGGSKPEIGGSNPDNNTHSKIPLEDPIKKTHYTESPTPSSSECDVETQPATITNSLKNLETYRCPNFIDTDEKFIDYSFRIHDSAKALDDESGKLPNPLITKCFKLLIGFVAAQSDEHLFELLKFRSNHSEWEAFNEALPLLDQFIRSQLKTMNDSLDNVRELCAIWLVQAFGYDLNERYFAGNPYSYKICLEISRRIRPYREAESKKAQEAENARIAKLQQERDDKFLSPDKLKEIDPLITPAEKVNVFKNSLIAKNQAGVYVKDGEFEPNLISYDQAGLKAAHQFFSQNPEITVAHLNSIIDRCIQAKLRKHVPEWDPLYHATRGTTVKFFFRHLDKIIGQVGLVDELPAIHYLDQTLELEAA